MKDFGFNEVLGLPVTFDEKITDETKWFAIRTTTEDRDYFLHQATFDRGIDGTWFSTLVDDERGNLIEFDSMKEVVEAVLAWHMINPKRYIREDYRRWKQIMIVDDTMPDDLD